MGMVFVRSASAASGLRPVFETIVSMEPATRSVSVKPGQTQLTVTPEVATSLASARVRPTTPCFAAQ